MRINFVINKFIYERKGILVQVQYSHDTVDYWNGTRVVALTNNYTYVLSQSTFALQ